MNEQMEFPKTFEEFAKEFGFKDEKEVYTNGIDLIPIFRVKQWIEQDNDLISIQELLSNRDTIQDMSTGKIKDVIYLDDILTDEQRNKYLG